MANNLTDAEKSLFADTAIEAAYQSWVQQERLNSHMPNVSRKQFLMRIRALIQSGRV